MTSSEESSDTTHGNDACGAAWSSLVRRSLEAWQALDGSETNLPAIAVSDLQEYATLDAFLSGVAMGSGIFFWFFQRREPFLAQKTMAKWSKDRLDDYILLPAMMGFVLRRECFFVSHFWQSKDDPDPGGKYLRLHQRELRPQAWSYIWIDWTCMPQEPRTKSEEAYFERALQRMPFIIQNCGFAWFYPPFEPRLWILYEIAQFILTCSGELPPVEDIKEFRDHVNEMVQTGVRSTLQLLVLLKRLPVDIIQLRRIVDSLTWFSPTASLFTPTPNGWLEIHRDKGTLRLGDDEYSFTPFPTWVSWLLS
ncbi:hypothetical protein N656DRAFT_428057 [Canariomyces notabilis]|uniref:Uncharacterized protein n=1 Tax=Canariomyces notabilis TaxID=2074819 RepID=A0AAN6T884_9PEZI|nr:hypothetical protein N656DRAFT_428057 [Canariomyces arenarius]